MNSLFLFKQPSFCNAYTTSVDTFKYSLQKIYTKYVCGQKRKNIDLKISLEVLKIAQSIADDNNPVFRL